mmetsp:Transcript_18481/g.54285  ORF Transcript_18481/g.54285 Transcript_18481/m.54285 type:complete len:324 (-) Transcript_18481:350-1321(-)
MLRLAGGRAGEAPEEGGGPSALRRGRRGSDEPRAGTVARLAGGDLGWQPLVVDLRVRRHARRVGARRGAGRHGRRLVAQRREEAGDHSLHQRVDEPVWARVARVVHAELQRHLAARAAARLDKELQRGHVGAPRVAAGRLWREADVRPLGLLRRAAADEETSVLLGDVHQEAMQHDVLAQRDGDQRELVPLLHPEEALGASHLREPLALDTARVPRLEELRLANDRARVNRRHRQLRHRLRPHQPRLALEEGAAPRHCRRLALGRRDKPPAGGATDGGERRARLDAALEHRRGREARRQLAERAGGRAGGSAAAHGRGLKALE